MSTTNQSRAITWNKFELIAGPPSPAMIQVSSVIDLILAKFFRVCLARLPAQSRHPMSFLESNTTFGDPESKSHTQSPLLPGCRRNALRRLLSWAFLLTIPSLVACDMMGSDRMMHPVEPRPAVTPAPTATPGGETTASFRSDVRPVLVENCAQCHGGQAGLYVDSYDTLMAGSFSNKVVIPGKPENSILVQRLTGELKPQMPPGGSLSREQIATIKTWILEGAPNN